jgi:hypothetical protein
MKEKGPIVTLLGKDRKNPRLLGRGNETRSLTQVKSFEAGEIIEGQPRSYVEKPLDITDGKQTALDTLESYNKMKALDLPVVDFLKIVKKREGSEDNYYIAMQDLSDAGKNLVVELWQPSRDPDTNQLHYTENLWKEAINADEIKDKMIKALAVLHNNGIFEFHPILSFALIVDREKINKGKKFPLDFKILDYSNFTFLGSRNANHLHMNTFDEQKYMLENLEPLQDFLGADEHEKNTIKSKYLKYREQGIKTFS